MSYHTDCIGMRWQAGRQSPVQLSWKRSFFIFDVLIVLNSTKEITGRPVQ
jgi:hypothetical protein